MYKRTRILLWIVLTAFCSFSLFFYPKVVISQTAHSYYPATYTPVNATSYVSGSVSDLQSNDGVCMVFQSYPSLASLKSLYAHRETITIAGTEYYVSSLNMADSVGTNLSVPLSSSGRSLFGKFIYPLTGVASIPSSTWTISYRAWLSNISEEISLNSPSSTPTQVWNNAENAYSSDDNYADSSNPGQKQEYGNYGFNLPPTANITKVEVGFEAYTLGDEGISVDLSWDGGTQWTAAYDSPPLGTSDPDVVSWIDFTTAANWTASNVSDANFRSRVKMKNFGTASDVLLDWLPVRITYVSNPSSAHMDVSILIRKSDGTVGQTLAVNAANTEQLSPTARTLTGTYNWPDYAITDETDYLEIDYYVDTPSTYPGVIANLMIDDGALISADQTRVANMMLPSEYTVEVEFSGYSDTGNWSEIVWAMNASWTTSDVFITLQLYDYSHGTYPTSGNGYITFLSSSVPNTDEMMTQAITTNTTDFRDYSGNWKMKIKGVKPTTSLFDLKLDLSTYEATPVAALPPWNWTWALPSIPLLILLFAGIAWRKRKNHPKFVGIELLNEITGGGIPDSCSVMLVGSSDSGKSILFQELVHEFLKMEKPCVYIAYECFPDEIRENMKKFQWNTSTYENQGKLSFIDCFSSSAKVQSKEKHFLNQPFSLVDLGIIISKATNEAGNGVKVFFDSLVPILTQLDPERVVDFLQDRIARVKGVQGNLIFTLNKESVDLALVSLLEEIVDCTIELDANQVNGEIARKLRIKKMRGKNFSDKWVRFEMNPQKGIVFPI